MRHVVIGKSEIKQLDVSFPAMRFIVLVLLIGVLRTSTGNGVHNILCYRTCKFPLVCYGCIPTAVKTLTEHLLSRIDRQKSFQVVWSSYRRLCVLCCILQIILINAFSTQLLYKLSISGVHHMFPGCPKGAKITILWSNISARSSPTYKLTSFSSSLHPLLPEKNKTHWYHWLWIFRSLASRLTLCLSVRS